MKLKKINGSYTGYAFFGIKATISKAATGWSWTLIEPGTKGFGSCPATPDVLHASGAERTKAACEAAIRAYGRNTKTTVKNLMSGGEVELSLDMVGGPCDPSTERYWSM